MSRKPLTDGREVERQAWLQMKHRCGGSHAHDRRNYVQRGITVCPEWKSPWPKAFETFFLHVGPKPSPKHSIDRIDNDGNYEPGNVRWATPYEQARNRRNVKLNTEIVKVIRFMAARGRTQRFLAGLFNIRSHRTIGEIVHRKIWP